MDISQIIQVSFNLSQSGFVQDNMNVCMVITSEQGNVLSSANRAKKYINAASVAADFGTNSNAYAHALTFFAQSPNAYNSGGEFYIGYWRKKTETVAATKATLTSGTINNVVISNLAAINDGSMTIKVDGVDVSLTALDFADVETITDVVNVIDAKLDNAKATISTLNNKIVITSATSGVSSTIGYASAASSGTDISGIVKMTEATGGVAVQGAAASTLTAEEPIDAFNALSDVVTFKGFVFIDELTVEQLYVLGAAISEKVLLYETISNRVYAKSIRLKKLIYIRMLYYPTTDKRICTAYMSRMHTINHSGNNTNQTMNLKQLADIEPIDLSSSDIALYKKEGVCVYVPIKSGLQSLGRVVESGENGRTDVIYNVIALTNAIQIAAYNALDGKNIPQTIAGIDSITSTISDVFQRFIRAGVIAPGTWTGDAPFGDDTIFKQNIFLNGYYILAGSISKQSQEDREARKLPIFRTAAKYSGFAESINIQITAQE